MFQQFTQFLIISPFNANFAPTRTQSTPTLCLAYRNAPLTTSFALSLSQIWHGYSTNLKFCHSCC